MKRGYILFGSITLQIASWFDIHGALGLPPLTPMQAAQLVGSGIFVLLWFASERTSAQASEEAQANDVRAAKPRTERGPE